MREILASMPQGGEGIFGTEGREEILERVGFLCREFLGAAPDVFLTCELSVGAAFGVRLTDGREVLVKVYPLSRSWYFLEDMCRIQSHLHESGFPCPKPLVGPTPFGGGYATVESGVFGGEYVDTHEPEYRRVMAATLAELTRIAEEVEETSGIGFGWRRPERGTLWPEPHSDAIDFVNTERGAEWIDAAAARAKSVLDDASEVSPLVVGHADWCSKHVKFTGANEVHTVYDWDSLRLDTEAAIVGAASATFPANRRIASSNLPTPDEARLFLSEYEAASGRIFTESELRVARASAVYTIAYLARCEHASDPSGTSSGAKWVGSYRESLVPHVQAAGLPEIESRRDLVASME